MLTFKFHAVNTTVTDAIRDYAIDRLSTLNKYHDDSLANVTIKVYNDKSTKATVQIGDLVAKAKDDDLYKAIDLVVEKLDGQYRKEKTKRLKREQHRTATKDLF